MVDTSAVVALLVGNDPAHERAVAAVQSCDETLVVPALTLVEIDYWLRKYRAVATWRSFAEDIAAGSYRLDVPRPEHLVRAAELESEYADLRLGVVDASIVVTCETLGETKLATLDRRHFSVVRPRHCDSLTLLPA